MRVRAVASSSERSRIESKRTIFSSIITRLLGAKNVHFPPARLSIVKERTRAPIPELSSSVTPARFTATCVEPESINCWIWPRKASSASPSLSGPSRSRMVACPALRIPIFTSTSQRVAKLTEMRPAIKGLQLCIPCLLRSLPDSSLTRYSRIC